MSLEIRGWPLAARAVAVKSSSNLGIVQERAAWPLDELYPECCCQAMQEQAVLRGLQ